MIFDENAMTVSFPPQIVSCDIVIVQSHVFSINRRSALVLPTILTDLAEMEYVKSHSADAAKGHLVCNIAKIVKNKRDLTELKLQISLNIFNKIMYLN